MEPKPELYSFPLTQYAAPLAGRWRQHHQLAIHQGDEGDALSPPPPPPPPSPPRPSASTTTPRPSKAKKPLVIDITNTRYSAVRKAAAAAGWDVYTEGKSSLPSAPDVFWTDMSVSTETATRLTALGTKVNHFPGMDGICRKVQLALNINRLSKRFPSEYGNLMPRTFVDYAEFSKHKQSLVLEGLKKRGPRKAFYIVKPSTGCMGKGIYITPSPPPEAFGGTSVVQEYMNDPLLIDNRKFDIRCYVLVLSVTPPRIFFFNEGIVRLCAEEFRPVNEDNAGTRCMHLSNYAVNKGHKGFEPGGADGESGGKRGFAFLSGWMERRGLDAEGFWKKVHELAVKTVLAVAPSVAQTYGVAAKGRDGFRCFEVLGFDVLVKSDLTPYLCEVNHSPSWFTDTEFDLNLKTAVLKETLQLVSIKGRRLDPAAGPDQLASSLGLAGVSRRLQRRRQVAEDSILSGFRRIYPAEDPVQQASYSKVLAASVGRPATAGPPPATTPVPGRKKKLMSATSTSQRPRTLSLSLPSPGGRAGRALASRSKSFAASSVAAAEISPPPTAAALRAAITLRA